MAQTDSNTSKPKFLTFSRFIDHADKLMKEDDFSPDAVVGQACDLELFRSEAMVWTRTKNIDLIQRMSRNSFLGFTVMRNSYNHIPFFMTFFDKSMGFQRLISVNDDLVICCEEFIFFSSIFSIAPNLTQRCYILFWTLFSTDISMNNGDSTFILYLFLYSIYVIVN